MGAADHRPTGRGGAARDAPIDYVLAKGSSDTMAMMIYQFYLPRHEFHVVNDPLDPSPTRFVFAPDDNDELSDSGAALGVARTPQHERPVGARRSVSGLIGRLRAGLRG